ncbi:hypothetical protein J8C06_01455 [Chloracidobacterium validum]|uniref:Glycosyltransferase RgtA/B/C/D-like domain-containing protein n=1 Tax=Chloracidobacterium validum TaxID=2821543 RepID=A0ABX8B8Z8_9BACT|nr:hypothetical protein [Chloracidobacterium validum]QUW03139.1 hypothetical protein J8C06_01455 [Chloracidobacterium validum]
MAACLVAAGAGVVHQWQTTRIGVLGDYAYIMDTAWRIAQGEVMYRDFVLPHSPLTFHIQATLIKLFGFSYQMTAWYCTVVNVLYVLLTYRLMRVLVSAWSAVGLCLPLAWLAPHSIYPHPFYDHDAALLILLNLNVLHWVMTTPVRPVVVFSCGMTTVLPALAKQNMGYPYLGLITLAIVWIGFWSGRKSGGQMPGEARSEQAIRWFLYGILGGGAAALGWIAATCGIENYLFWVFVSASRRLARPTLSQTYGTWSRWVNGVALVLGWWLWQQVAGEKTPGWKASAGLASLLGPFIVVIGMTLLAGHVFVDFNYPLLSLWVPVMLLALVTGTWSLRLLTCAEGLVPALLPWLCPMVAFFSFLSQGHVRSSYGIWALFFLMLGSALNVFPSGRGRLGISWALGLMMTVAAVPYIQKNVRLRYVDQSGDRTQTATSGPLRGLTTHAPYLSDFSELLGFVEATIPPDASIICLPQEEPFYVTTGRYNPLPVVIFDRTANPLSPGDLFAEAQRRQVTWVILKKRPQMKEVILSEIEGVPALFLSKYKVFAELDGYLILHRPSSVTSNSP